ncbi:TIGR02587 family membrane protein [Mangrovicella endophytica]|uniref:TIGR02587 family membrane protein n=1 Tax=Mangrovicella endophytica TaxID=2066697 RepID=UPI000C9E9EEE|nr:TIGR02587 family membrane protein [Mangrovicella endophytica]
MIDTRLTSSLRRPSPSAERREFLVGIGRAFGGALLFALPMLMTMEMWWIGLYIDRWRLFLLLILNLPFLLLLAIEAGFEPNWKWRAVIRDAMVAYAIGMVASLIILVMFGVIKAGMTLDEVIGKVAIQSVPASIGALLARSQFGEGKAGDDRPRNQGTLPGVAGEFAVMAIGALYLGLNVAPTEEMILISYMMTQVHILAMIAASILIMHGFVYAVEFSGGHPLEPEGPWWSPLLRLTIPGYVLALLISLFVLWVFGRTDGVSLTQTLMTAIVLGLPCAVGAASARLVL